MKILYLHQFFTTPAGTGGTRSYELARRLVAAGHEVTVVCGSLLGGNTGLAQPFVQGRREGVVDGIRVIEFELPYHNEHGFLRRALTFLSYSLKVSRMAVRSPADLIFATSPPLTVAIPVALARLFTRRTIVAEVRDPWPEAPRAMGVIRNPLILAGMEVLQTMYYRSASRMVALSPGIMDAIAAAGVPRERIALIPNGSDMALFSGREAPRLLQAPDDHLVALYAGTLGLANGLDQLLDAAAELKRRGETKVHIALCGAGQQKPALEARVARDGLDNVTFLPPVPKAKVGELMAGADLGLQILMDVPVFYYGTSPNKFFDYIAAGLPVLTNYPGWVADLVTENHCGFAVPPGKAAAFADALQQAQRDKQALRAMGASAARLAAREFARDDLAKRLIQWVESAASPAK